MLAEAVSLDQSGAGQQAIEKYLAAWAFVRSPAIADRIDALSMALESTLSVVDVTGAGGFKPAVAKRISASSPLDVGPVVTALRLRKRAVGALFVAEQLVSLLQRHPDDPRLTSLAVETCRNIRESHQTAVGRSAFLQLCSLALSVRDPRHTPRLIAEADAASTVFPTRDAKAGSELSALRARVEEARAEEGLDEPKWVARTLAALEARKPRDLQALLEGVYAAPEDVGRRLVYADALQEAGDPRGEFIALQCRRQDGKVSAREKALLRNHGRAWLGAHDPAIERHGLEFRRGFLAVARVKWKHALVGPEWATIEALDLPASYGREDALLVSRFLQRTDLRVLRALWVSRGCLSQLERPLPTVTCLGVSREIEGRALGFFPGLRRFETSSLDASGAKTLLRACRALEAIELASAEGVPLVRGAVPQVVLSTRFGLEDPISPIVFVLRGEQLDRLEIGTLKRRLPEWTPASVEEWVAQLPRGFVSSVTLDPDVDLPWLRRSVRPCVKKGAEWRQAEVRVPSWQDFV